MIVSALLTSIGINLGLCVLFFTLYSILRKQPVNNNVYAPRLVAEGKTQKRSDFNLDRLLPSPGWVKRAWKLSEEDILSTSGLDAVVFIRIFIFSIKVFSVAGVIGVFILLPVNLLGNQLKDIDFFDLPNRSLDVFSIANVQDGSNWLWLHFCAVYVITAVVCYFLYDEYKYIATKRIACFYSSKPQPDQFTILVRGIPSTAGNGFGNSVESFFKEYHSSTYLSHSVVRKMDKHRGLNEVPAAFVSFNSRYGAAIASHMQQSVNPTEWVTEQAPEPHDVYWPFFTPSFMRRWVSKLVVIFSTVVLTLLFLIPVFLVQGLTNLSKLETFFPFLKGILSLAVVSQVITGYLPSLILQMFLYFIPPIMRLFSSMQGYISHSEIEKSACSKVLWFTIWNIFFANVLSGSVLNQVKTFLDPKNIPLKLAVAVPGQASFFITYVVTTGWTSLSSEVFQMTTLIYNFISKPFVGSSSDDLEVSSLPYGSMIPKVLFFGLLGMTYFFLAPLILPFILVYYCLGYIIYRNQILNVYAPKYETSGCFWPIVHNSMIFSLILMQAIAVGMFGLKKLPLASSLIVPLLVLTLLFNEYCRKRFLPIFKGYSAESLIRKDRSDQHNPAMAEFLEKLVTVYRDPAVLPSSGEVNDNRAPLLSPA